MTIRIEVLRTFVTVAEEGNIKTAAARLLRTSSAVSMTLSQLEEHLGGPLFEGDRKNALTALGSFVRDVAAVMVRDHDRGIEIIEAFSQGHVGRLRIATVPSVATHLLPVLLRGFIARHSRAEIELTDTDSAQVLQRVASGEADFGICGTPPARGPLIFQPMFEDPFRLVCTNDARLARLDRPVQWADLAEEELILNEASQVIPAPDYATLASDARLTMRNMASLLAMVQAGVGVTLLPALACSALPATLTSLDLADSDSRRTVGAVIRSGAAQSPLTLAFRQYLDSNVATILPAIGLRRFSAAY